MQNPLIIALDFDTKEEALAFAKQLNPSTCRVKVAATLFTRYGPNLIKALQDLGFEVFLDLKFHDIPQQVAGACRQAARLGVWMVTVHCAGGVTMLRAAQEALVEHANKIKPLLVGVTVLTSLSSEDLSQTGVSCGVIDTVTKRAELACFSHIDGVVSSAAEVPLIRKVVSPTFLCVTPGIRLAEDVNDDQKRVVTPQVAIQQGSDYLVIGRSITRASDPQQVIQSVLHSL
jgi:orotidine-5'-phosphate decarboxylase